MAARHWTKKPRDLPHGERDRLKESADPRLDRPIRGICVRASISGEGNRTP